MRPSRHQMGKVVGFVAGKSFDNERPSWDGSGPRPLKWAAWYPAVDQAKVDLQSRSCRFLDEPVARNAAAHGDAGRYPVVLLSHGTGGVAAGLEWLGRRLAQEGFVTLGVNHHGNTGSEPYRAEGFLCLWERARDLSVLLEHPDWRGHFSIEMQRRAHVAGFSAGAYTAMLMLGARVSYSQFENANPVRSPIRGPREFPNLADELPDLLERNPLFRQSWERRTAAYADERLLSALVIAPGRSVRGFAPDSLAKIIKPVSIIVGDADAEAPAAECSAWLHRQIPGSELEILRNGVGHYTFLPEPSLRGLSEAPEVFADAPRVNRKSIHDYVAKKAEVVFKRASGPSPLAK